MTGSPPKSTSNSAQPIDQYIELLQENTNTAYIRTILIKALSDPHVFAGFTELREIVANALLESSTGKAMLNTLDLFSYGTYNDYLSAEEGTYIKLTAAQLTKLKSLTVVTIVQQRCDEEANKADNSNSNTIQIRRRNRIRRSRNPASATNNTNSNCNVIPYSILHPYLGTDPSNNSTNNADKTTEQQSSIRPLEDLLIHCIYSNLLPPGTKLDHRQMSLVIRLSPHSKLPGDASSNILEPNAGSGTVGNGSGGGNTCGTVLCRDVKVETDVPDMISKLEAFYLQGKERIHVLDSSLETLKNDTRVEIEHLKTVQGAIEETKQKVMSSMGSNPRMGGGGANNPIRMMMEGQNWEGGGGGGEPSSSLISHGRSRHVKRSRGGHGNL